MKKIVITILALLITPVIAGAADEVYFDDNTSLEVNGLTVTIQGGTKVDDFVVTDTSATFSLSANSVVVIRSTDKYTLSNNLVDVLCGSSYSQIEVTGATLGSTLVFTPSSNTCSGTTGGGTYVAPSGGGSGTVTPTTPTTPVTTTGEVTATASGGGETTLTTDEGTIAGVSLPSGAVSASTNIAVNAEEKGAVLSAYPAPTNRNVVGGYVYNYTAIASGVDVTSFDSQITLTFSYTDDQISGLTESSLRVFYWKESTSEWVALETSVDTDTNTLTVNTDHFTYFAIMGLTEGTEDDEDLTEETSGDTTIVNGDLIRNPNASGMAQFDIYIVKFINDKKFKRLILSPHVFESYEHFDKNGNGSPWDDVIDVSQSTMDEQTTSDLVRTVGDARVYKLVASGDTGTKQWLNMTAEEFASDGYDADSIYEINATDRDAYAAGSDIKGASASSSETIIINTEFLRIRSIPSTDGDIIGQVYEGEIYELLDEQDGWYQINANSITGWCYGADGTYASKQ